MQHCRLSLRKDAGFAFFFGCLCIVAFFFCLMMLQWDLLFDGSISDEECNIAGCPWGRMQGLHSSFESLCIVAFFFFCPTLCSEPRSLSEWIKENRQKKKNQPAIIYRVKSKITTCIIAFFLFCPDSSPVNALCRILLLKGDIYPSDWNQGCNGRFDPRKKAAVNFCAELVDWASESIVSVFYKAILS